jgi:hypothetical protein
MPVTACRCMHNWNYMPLHACLPRPAAACIIATACRRMHDCHCLPPHTCLPLLAAACMLATACRCMHYCHSLPLHAFRPLQILGMHDVQVIEHLHGVCCRAGECLPLPSCMLPHALMTVLAAACIIATACRCMHSGHCKYWACTTCKSSNTCMGCVAGLGIVYHYLPACCRMHGCHCLLLHALFPHAVSRASPSTWIGA